MKGSSTVTARSMLCVALFCGGATAQPMNEAGELELLKQHYLTCNRIATLRRLSPTEIMRCSEVAEALLRRGFGGDFDRLLAWSRAQPSARAATAGASAAGEAR
jgi:hypothetical protein